MASVRPARNPTTSHGRRRPSRARTTQRPPIDTLCSTPPISTSNPWMAETWPNQVVAPIAPTAWEIASSSIRRVAP
jgi:hypothetical protein